MGLPIETIIRKTVFDHFCAGESIEKSEPAIQKLAKYHVHTILDFSAEGAKTEAGFDKTFEETLRIVRRAAESENIPFAVFKPSGVASIELLEKVQSKVVLSDAEQQAYQRVRDRFYHICKLAHDLDIPVLIDAEETWIQDPIDNIVYEMMALFNKERPRGRTSGRLHQVGEERRC